LQQSPLEKHLQDLLVPAIEAGGFEAVELRFGSEGGRRVLRIILDAANGVTLDECAAMSRTLAPLLDADPEVRGSYTLEVSSPGINRPLTKPEHFQRFVGERAKLRLHEKLEGGITVTGVLRGLQDGVLEIETPAGMRHVPLEMVARARLHRDLDALLKRSPGRSAAPEDPGAKTDARRWKR
jgi:ribosome maturation factor RimP